MIDLNIKTNIKSIEEEFMKISLDFPNSRKKTDKIMDECLEKI
jgi:hypothetical protein